MLFKPPGAGANCSSTTSASCSPVRSRPRTPKSSAANNRSISRHQSLLTRALLPLLKQNRGQVVSVASLASMLPLAESPGYCASKAGLRAFMLALSLREKETGVRISLVHPGAVDTPMLRHEAVTGGSALNFLSRPLSPDTVATAVVGNLDRPHLETSLPRHDGWLVKLVGLTPGFLQRIRPLLEITAQSGLEKYRRDNGIPSLPR